MTTICAKCRHHISLDPGSERADMWYNHVCGASPIPLTLDVVTGKQVPEPGAGDRGFRFCNYVNKGDCPKYEAAE